MITLKQYCEIINYRITEGYEYQWHCYGSNAYGLASSDGFDSPSTSIIFDTANDTVYQVEVHDYKNNRSYRMINPQYAKAFAAECVAREFDDVAYDGVKFIDLETEEDFIEKATAITKGEEYDTRVSVPLDLSNDLLFELMKRAHEEDVTLNQYMEMTLKQVIADLGVVNDTNR